MAKTLRNQKKTNNAPLPPAITIPQAPRSADGRFVAGFSGQPGGDAGRARRALNLATIQGMFNAFQRGGQKAIDKLMDNNPAAFVKMLVLLVPRELEVMHSQGVKGMTDEQLERALEAIELLMRERNARTIEGTTSSVES